MEENAFLPDMKKIEVSYRCCGILIKKKRIIPNAWEDISVEQLIAIAEHYLGITNEDIFLAKICCINRNKIKNMPLYFKYKLANEFKFIVDYSPYNSFIIKNIKQLQSPKNRLEGMSFGQFMFADSFYNNWCENEQAEELNKFIACLYLPENYIFSEKYINTHAQYCAKIDRRIKYAISLNYRLIKEWLTNKYPLIYERNNAEKKQRKTSKNGWVNVFENIVGDDIIHADNYAQLPLHTVLRFLTNKIKENAKIK
ncbi:MAG: hypothetical protein NTZ33_06380 [Bacteroidetes bacterium]|nr:hypothetical protein [Bacteroidota bacterium]